MKRIIGSDVRCKAKGRMDCVRRGSGAIGMFVGQGRVAVCDRDEWRAVVSA